MKKLFIFIFFAVYLSFSIGHVSLIHASYVLPYPSAMPGNKLYTIGKLIDKIKGYWSFGSLSQTKYQLSLSDKYLVEAKTLFEYHQYLLASSALSRSDNAFRILPNLVHTSKNEGKEVNGIANIIIDAAAEHTRVLEIMKETTPDAFTWSPEKTAATELNLHGSLQQSIDIRASVSASMKAF